MERVGRSAVACLVWSTCVERKVRREVQIGPEWERMEDSMEVSWCGARERSEGKERMKCVITCRSVCEEGESAR